MAAAAGAGNAKKAHRVLPILLALLWSFWCSESSQQPLRMGGVVLVQAQFIEETDSPVGAPTGSEDTSAPVGGGDEDTNVPTETPEGEGETEPTEAPTKAPVEELPTAIPTAVNVEVTDAPSTKAPISLEPTPAPSVNRTTNFPTAPPSLAPTTAAPTVRNTTEPTTEPSLEPTNVVPTAVPSIPPTQSPKPSLVEPIPTRTPSDQPSPAPQPAPVATTKRPTSQPVVAPTPQDGTLVEEIVPNLQLAFRGATEMSAAEIVDFQNAMTEWFDAYFNGEEEGEENDEEKEGERSFLRRLVDRMTATPFLYQDTTTNNNKAGTSDPENTQAISTTIRRSTTSSNSSGRNRRIQWQQPARRGLQNAPNRVNFPYDMRSNFDVTDQDSTSTARTNFVTYSHSLEYMAPDGASPPTDIVLYPFLDADYTEILAERLSTSLPDSFSGLRTPIDLPVAIAPTTAPTAKSNSKGFWTLPVIIGISAGGAALLIGCCAGVYIMANRNKRPENYLDARQDSQTKYVSDDDNNGNRDDDDDDDYKHDDLGLPTQFQMSSMMSGLGNDDDIISTMDDPTVVNKMHSIDASAMSGGYGDQRCEFLVCICVHVCCFSFDFSYNTCFFISLCNNSVATVDYDYSKAYGGGGDHSVISSVGGTLGDATRQTAGELAAGSAAARAALGASFDDRGSRRNMNNNNSNHMMNSNNNNGNDREELIVIDAPAGKLGVVIDTPDDGAPVVHAVKDTSVIAHLIQVGDKLIKVDDEDVRSMTAIKVSKLISKKSANPVRRLTIIRTMA